MYNNPQSCFAFRNSRIKNVLINFIILGGVDGNLHLHFPVLNQTEPATFLVLPCWVFFRDSDFSIISLSISSFSIYKLAKIFIAPVYGIMQSRKMFDPFFQENIAHCPTFLASHRFKLNKNDFWIIFF
jgi:hypothetical protein